MKKIISFDKNLEFKSMIGDISSISLDHTLKFVDGSNISGNFLISGSYKLTEASRLEDTFNFEVPAEIILNEVLDLESAKIDIEDFNYHVENDDTLVCHIEVKVEGVEVISVDDQPEDNLDDKTSLEEEQIPIIEEKKESVNLDEGVLNRDCDSEIKRDVHNNVGDVKEIEDVTVENEDEDIIDSNANEEFDISNNVGSLFSSFSDADETFSTYSIYILRGEETIDTIMTKYKVTKEELENYNDLSNLSIGSKIIIPTANERD